MSVWTIGNYGSEGRWSESCLAAIEAFNAT